MTIFKRRILKTS